MTDNKQSDPPSVVWLHITGSVWTVYREKANAIEAAEWGGELLPTIPLATAERLAEALDLELTHHCKGSTGCPECRRVREVYREWREFRRATQQKGEP